MKKLYLFVLLCFIAFIGSGQKYYSESDMRFYDLSDHVVKKSAAISPEKYSQFEVTAAGDTVWAGTQISYYFDSRTRGYFFQAQSTFNIIALMCAEDANPSATMQSVEIISFGTTYPAAYPGPGSPHSVLFSALNIATGWIDCDVELVQGNYYGIVGAVHDLGGTTMYNSYGSPQDLIIDGISTFCDRLLVQAPLSAGSPASGDYMSESGGSIGRIHFVTGTSCIKDIVQNNDLGEAGAVVSYSQPASWASAIVAQIDNSGLTSGDFFPVDTTVQSYKIDYGGGTVDTCTFNVIVIQATPVVGKDTIAPVASCRNITIQLGDIFIIRNPATLDKGSYDNEGTIVSLSVDKDTFTCSDIGENIVTLTVTDDSGNQATCESKVTVIDVDIPVLQPIADIDIQMEEGICDTAITYPEVMVEDNCDVTLTLLEGIGPDGGPFPVGTTVETWEAKDLSGNADTLSFSVVITAAATVPVIDSIEDLTLDNDGETVEIILVGISDKGCNIDSLMVTASTDNDTIITSLDVEYVNMSTTGLLTVGLEKGAVGSATITVRVEDNQGGITEVDFVINVIEINDVPTLLFPEADYTVNAARELKIVLSPVSGEYFGDEEDPILTLNVHEEGSADLPGWAVMSGDTMVCTPILPDTGCVTIIVEASDSEGASAMDTFTICVDGYVLGLNDIMDLSGISMYPNPTSGRVIVAFNHAFSGETGIRVYTLSGQEVFHKEYLNSSNIRFDLSDEVSGIYLVQIIQGSEVQTRKLVLDKK